MANPQDKVIEIQKDIKNKAEDYRDFLDDLKGWEEEIKKKDASVSKRSKIEADYPPIRGTVDEKTVLKMAEEKEKDDPILRQKDLGNEFFKKGKYSEAAACYAKGIAYDTEDKNVYLLHANRAMALLKLEKWGDAEEEATKCIQSNRTYTKGFFRRALARRSAGKLKDAMNDLNTVLVLEPGSKEAKTQLAQLETEVKKAEKAAVPAAPQRKKLQIEEVDDDDDDDEEVEIPIKRKPAPAPAATQAAAAPASAPAPAPKPVSPNAKSGVEMLDDDDEPVKPYKKKPATAAHADPNAPIPAQPAQAPPAAAATAAPKPTAAAPAPTPTTAAGQDAQSPKGKKVFVPRQAALDAAEEYKKSGKREVPRTFLEFERAWTPMRGNKKELAEYLRQVPRTSYSDFFRSNITEDILGDIVAIIHDDYLPAGSEDDVQRSFDILKQFAQLSRLSALLLFAEDSVAGKLTKIPDLLEGKVPGASLAKVRQELNKRLDD